MTWAMGDQNPFRWREHFSFINYYNGSVVEALKWPCGWHIHSPGKKNPKRTVHKYLNHPRCPCTEQSVLNAYVHVVNVSQQSNIASSFLLYLCFRLTFFFFRELCNMSHRNGIGHSDVCSTFVRSALALASSNGRQRLAGSRWANGIFDDNYYCTYSHYRIMCEPALKWQRQQTANS